MSLLTVGGQQVDVSHVASQLGDVKLPFIPEFLQSLVKNTVLKKLFRAIGPELIQLLVDASDGLTQDEIEKHSASLTTLAADATGLPAFIIEPIIRGLLSYATKGKALTLTA